MSFVLHSADVSNPAKPLPLARTWCVCVCVCV